MGTEEEEEEEGEEQNQEEEEEARRLQALAEAMYASSNIKAALKYVKRAQRLCPENDGLTSMATAFEILDSVSSSGPEWYKILRAEPFSHSNVIKKQFRKLALALHPDKNPYAGSEEAFKLVNEGFRFLSDRVRRKEYDTKLRLRIQDEKMKEGDGPDRSLGNSFRTKCSTCRVSHEFDKKYLGHNLVCPSCRKSFEAVDGESGSGSEGTDGCDDGKVRIVDLKRKVREDDRDGDRDRDKIEGDWGGGRLRSSGLKRRTCSVGEIMNTKLKIDDDAMTLADFQSRVKPKTQNEKTRSILEEKKQQNEKEKEKDKVTIKVTKRKRDSKKVERSKCLTSTSALQKQKGSSDRDSAIITALEDSDFYDFDKDRIAKSFKQGQVWAIYDGENGMPRLYVLIEELVSANPFEVKISRLDYYEGNAERTRFLSSCGIFRVSRETRASSMNIFSHLVDCERAAREVYQVYPKKGSVWALCKEEREYEVVVFLTSYSEVRGLSMAYLEKVDGFKTVFKRRQIGPRAIEFLEKDDIGLFSHQIPARKLSGDEAPGLPNGCWELDPASLPTDLLKTG